MKDFAEIVNEINRFLNESPLNIVEKLGNMRIYDEALVCAVKADDSMFDRLKEADAVGAHHMSPREWLPGAKSVISFFLPYSEDVRKSNHTAELPSTEWLYARIEGEACNKALREHLVRWLMDSGAKALSPQEDPRFTVVERRSSWSERHVAFIAGLGTFSLSKSLITSRGSAGRLGSVITDMELEYTHRGYDDLYEYCTKCGDCILRCPAGAITEKGKEHGPCSDFLDKTMEQFKPRYGCGKCQTAVACEYLIP